MIATWKQCEGQAVDGIPLLRLLGGSESSAVFLGEFAGEKCAVKLVPSEEAVAQIPLARWQQASKLTHPHLTKIHQWGRARLEGRPMVYLVMEFAEEELASVDRPLTPKEAREMLAPAVRALGYLHSQKFAHGRIKPANVLSVSDVLKISGDAPLRIGEQPAAGSASSPCDPPELANSGVTPAGDVWSLGVTLVEALTKELPVCTADPAMLPVSLKPDAFREVAAGCLQRDPARRWKLSDVEQWLERGTIPAPKAAKRRWVLPAAVAAALLVIGLIVWPRITGSSNQPAGTSNQTTATGKAESPQPTEPVAKDIDPPRQTPPLAQAPAPPPPPSAAKNSKKTEPKQQAAVPTASSAPAKADPVKVASVEPPPAQPQDAVKQEPPAAPTTTSTAKTAEIQSADVVHGVIPDVPAKARVTIHGKVPIVVRIEADAAGAVTNTKIESGGSSPYFANLALAAARQWKFAPGDGARAWNVRFEFTQNAQHPVAAQVSPTH